MQPFTHLDLCSGIGGFALAARVVWGDRHHLLAFCEIDPYCGSILTRHWPDTPLIQNIFDLDGTQFLRPDFLTAGFPCQPYSVAGKRKGARDDRDLWPQVFRVVQESRPRWCCFENVAGFLLMGFDRTKIDMESEGYEVGEPLVIPACAVDAPHRRDRVWIIAHLSDTGGDGKSQCEGVVEDERGRVGDGGNSSRLRTSQTKLEEPPELPGSSQERAKALPHSNRRRRKQQNPSLGESQQPDPNRAEPLLDATSAGCEERITPSGGDSATLGSADGGDAIASHWRTPLVVEGYRIPPPESGIRVLAHGVSGELAFIKRVIDYEESIHPESNAKASLAVGSILRAMWWHRELATTSPHLYARGLHDSLPEMPHGDSHGRWFMGCWSEEDQGLRDLWEAFYSKSLEEAQNLQLDLLERVGKAERKQTMAQHRVASLKALGNAIVPEVAIEIFRAIRGVDDGN